jgi:hypothetical protein
MMNAMELVVAIGKVSNPVQSLAQWSTEQAERGRQLTVLGEQMERAFVWEAPDFSRMAESEAREWWSKSISFPDEFSYVSASGD